MLIPTLLIAVAGIYCAKRVWYCWFNPLALFVFLWSSLLVAFHLDLLPYYQVEGGTLLVIAGSGVSFCAGCLISSFLFLRSGDRRTQVRLEEQVDLVKLRRVAIGLYLGGLALLAGYVWEIEARFTLLQVLTEPWQLRAALPEGEFGWYLRFFYFTMPASVLAFLHLRLTRRHRILMHTIVWSSLAFGVATTGRTAVIWLMIWLACVYLFLAERDGREGRALAAVGVTLACGFLIFVVFGNWVGKTYENSAFTTTKNVSDAFAFLVVPYYYFTASIPAFQNLIAEPSEWTLGTYTFLPIVKVAGPILGLEPPSEVSDFTRTPYLANTYTYLLPYYHDFGLPGVLLCPAVLGFAVGFLFSRMKFSGMSLGLLFTNSLLATVIVFSVAVNRLISPPTWCFLAMAPLVGRCCARTRSRQIAAFWPHGGHTQP